VHELALASEIVRLLTDVARGNGNCRLQSALIELGELTQIEPETLRFGFEVASKDTPAQGCQLVYKRVPITARCRQCGWQGEPTDGICGGCQAPGLDVVGGREMRLVSVDIEDD